MVQGDDTQKRRILLATSNKGKVREFSGLLANSDIELRTLTDLPPEQRVDVSETGDSYEQNATLKAVAFGDLTGFPTLADDSGFEVEALDNEPGVRSARWLPGTDAERTAAILRKLESATNRRARFVCVLCFYQPATKSIDTFRGEVVGTVATEPHGEDGFGYDPIFVPEGYEMSFASLGSSIKQKISHRAVALEHFRTYLEQKGWL